MTDETENDGSGASGKRMTDAEFAEAMELYELGTAGISELASQFGVSRQALSQRFKSAGAVKGSRASELAAAAKKGAASASEAVAERFADNRGIWIEEARVTGVKQLRFVRQLAQKLVQDAVKAGHGVATIDDDLKSVQRFNKILVDNLESTLAVLEADKHVDVEDLPILTITDLTDDDVLEHHKGTGALPEDMTVEEMLLEESGQGFDGE